MSEKADKNRQLAFDLEVALQEGGVDNIRRSRLMDAQFVQVHKDVEPGDRPWWYELCVYIYEDGYDVKYLDFQMDSLHLGWPNDVNLLDGPATGISQCLDLKTSKNVTVGETHKQDFRMTLNEAVQCVLWWKKQR